AEPQYIADFLTSIVCHEMGHILGLRHNFVASTFHNMKELEAGDGLRQTGVVASVMDYVPFNPQALHAADCPFWTSTVGPYDCWAIEYGYTPPQGSAEAEKARLRAIAARCNEPGLAYQSDEV